MAPTSPRAGKPRLLVVASTFPSHADDGVPGFARDLAVAVSREFDTTVLVPAVAGAPARESLGEVSIIRFRYFFRRWEDLAQGAIIENVRSKRSRLLQVPPFFIAEWLAIRRAVKQLRPDVLHVHWIIPQGVAAYPYLRRIPTLVTTLGGDLYALKDPLTIRVKMAVVRRAKRLTTMNVDMRERLIALGAAPQDVTVVPMGADLGAIRAAAAASTRVPGRLLFVGRLVEKKGVTVLLDALRTLSDSTWSLVIVGDGPLRADLQRQAAGLRVSFAGQLGRTQLAEQYGCSEIVVVPSVPAANGDQDGLPVAMLEAMGVGCPVIASDLPGLNEAVQDGVSGVLVPAGDVTALADALRSLLTDPERRDRLGRGASIAADSLSVDAVGARYRELLAEVAGTAGIRGTGR